MLLVSCAKEADTTGLVLSKDFLNVDLTTLTFGADGGSATINVSSTGNWSFSGGSEWLKVNPMQGNASQLVTITAERNASHTTPRTATLLLQGSDNLNRTIAVVQAAQATTLSASPLVIQFGAVADNKTLTITGNAVWTISVSDEWLKVSPLSGEGDAEVIVTTTDNITLQPRHATITINNNITCEVEQAAGQLPVPVINNVPSTGRYDFTTECTFTSMYEVTEYGICYSTANAEPTTADTCIPGTPGNAAGTFTATATGLTSYTKYYVRAYAVSKAGTGYSPVREITTQGGAPGEDDNQKPNI